MKVVAWFSCGAASAVASMLTVKKYGHKHDIRVVRIEVPEEHEDGERFAGDIAAWIGRDIETIRSDKYASCEDVWRRRRYMSGVAGAICTEEMKKAPRRAFTAEWRPDVQIFGFTAEERSRAGRFRTQNPEIGLVCPLIDDGLTKADCHAIIRRAGIEHHAMYRLGFPNANCIGCVKAQSPKYWQLVREHFPQVFEARRALGRDLGVRLVKLTSGERKRIFLDDLPTSQIDVEPIADTECSLFCAQAER